MKIFSEHELKVFLSHFSTVSSSLNSMSAVLWEDVLKSKFMHLTESKKTVITKVLGESFVLRKTIQPVNVSVNRLEITDLNKSNLFPSIHWWKLENRSIL